MYTPLRSISPNQPTDTRCTFCSYQYRMFKLLKDNNSIISENVEMVSKMHGCMGVGGWGGGVEHKLHELGS